MNKLIICFKATDTRIERDAKIVNEISALPALHIHSADLNKKGYDDMPYGGPNEDLAFADSLTISYTEKEKL